MKDLPPAFRLEPLMNALLRRKQRSPQFAAGKALKDYRDAESAWHGLGYAQELSDYLSEHDPNSEERRNEPVSVRGAILQHAILLCVRATEIGQRKGLKIKSQLSEANRLAHAKFVKLRNKAIAHFDYERPFGANSFADDAFVFRQTGPTRFAMDLAERRVVYQAELERELANLIKEAVKLGHDMVLAAQQDAERHLEAVTEADESLWGLVFRNRFDAVGFFGDEESASRFLTEGRAHDSPKKGGAFFDGWPDATDFEQFNLEPRSV